MEPPDPGGSILRSDLEAKAVRVGAHDPEA
jgi:hypothetical protein